MVMKGRGATFVYFDTQIPVVLANTVLVLCFDSDVVHGQN